jgi:hypothetical protein
MSPKELQELEAFLSRPEEERRAALRVMAPPALQELLLLSRKELDVALERAKLTAESRMPENLELFRERDALLPDKVDQACAVAETLLALAKASRH